MTDPTAALSAPEALMLLSLPRYDAVKVLKTGFMGLIAQGVLRLEIEDHPGLIRTRYIPHLKIADNVPGALPPIASSLVQVVRAAAPGGLMQDIVVQSRREYGRALIGFAKDRVIPSLVSRGLTEAREKRLLGFIPSRYYALTAAGETEKIRLENALREAKTIPRHLDSDPARVAALVLATGSAIILVDELRPFYGHLSRALGGGSAGGADGGDFSDGGSGFTNFDFSAVDFSSFDSGAFTSFDAGFSDAGGGDGGGDSGGSSGC